MPRTPCDASNPPFPLTLSFYLQAELLAEVEGDAAEDAEALKELSDGARQWAERIGKWETVLRRAQVRHTPSKWPVSCFHLQPHGATDAAVLFVAPSLY